jgi:hypothetical protein
MGLGGQPHAPAALYPEERTPVIHWIVGWVGLRAGPDTEAFKLSSSLWNVTLLVVSKQELCNYGGWANRNVFSGWGEVHVSILCQ